jgi:hypothetical protein
MFASDFPMYISDADELKEQHRVRAIKKVENGVMTGLNKDLIGNSEFGLIGT